MRHFEYSKATLRYYLYISKTKLEMLYQQITPIEKNKRSFEWKATLGVLSAAGKTEKESVPTQEKMLEMVIKEIEDAGQVGTVDDPNIYVKGTLPMRWGI